MTRRLSCVPLGLLMLAVILTGSTAPVAEAPAQYPQTCSSNWCIVDIPDTPPSTYVMNNQWNTRGAHGSQSVTVYGSNSPVVWSTTWDWKRKQEWTVTTYPSAITGWHWGWHFAPPQTGFPVALSPGSPSQPGWLMTTFPMPRTGARARAGTTSPSISSSITPATQEPTPPQFELMVWLSYSRADLWIGYTPIAEDVDVGGYRRNVFHTASTNAVFVPTANQVDVDDANLNLMDFIGEIVTHNLGISRSWYLSSVEFGIEVYQGRGTLTVTS